MLFLACCIFTACQPQRISLAQLEGKPLGVVECKDWSELLAQPRIDLGNGSQIQIGFDASGVEQFGIIQLLCLQCNHDGVYLSSDSFVDFGQLRVEVSYTEERPQSEMKRSEEDLQRLSSPFELFCYSVVANDRLSGIRLFYEDECIVEHVFQGEFKPGKWAALKNIQFEKEIEDVQQQITTDFYPEDLSKHSLVRAYPCIEGEMPVIYAGTKAALKKNLFPLLQSKAGIGLLNAEAIADYKIRIHSKDFYYEDGTITEHLLLRVFINDKCVSDLALSDYEDPYHGGLSQVSLEGVSVELAVNPSLWGATKDDELRVQLLWSVDDIEYDIYDIPEEELIDELMDLDGAIRLYLSKPITLMP